MRLRVELDVIFEKYVHVTQLGTNLKNVTKNEKMTSHMLEIKRYYFQMKLNLVSFYHVLLAGHFIDYFRKWRNVKIWK